VERRSNRRRDRRLGGITRSTVLGKVFRLRLKAQDRKRAPPAAGDAPARRRAGKLQPLKPAAAKSRRKTLLDLTNECCRWPYGELGGKQFFFCGEIGADVARGVPYCPRHMAHAYIVPPSLVKPLHKILACAPLKLSSASDPNFHSFPRQRESGEIAVTNKRKFG
jgi:hypothetical protein